MDMMEDDNTKFDVILTAKQIRHLRRILPFDDSKMCEAIWNALDDRVIHMEMEEVVELRDES